VRQKKHDDTGDDAADGPGTDPDDQLVERIEAGFRVHPESVDIAVDPLESSVHLRTQFADVGFDAIEASADGCFESVGPFVDLFEATVDLFEAEIDPFRELVDAFFGARPSHRLHG
jgi:hypothetical protein